MNAYVAEFLGTALMVLLATGVGANVSLNNTKGNASGWMVIATGNAFGVYLGVVVAGPYSGAHINPALTIALAMHHVFAWSKVPGYILAQMAGGICGGLVMYLFYRDHFAITSDQALKRVSFCTEPAICKGASNLFSEIIGTFVLVFVIFHFTQGFIDLPGTAKETPIGLGSVGALPVALLMWAIGLSLGGTTGYAINPARDLGPRIALALVGKKINTSPDWGYAWVPLLGPIIGGLLAAGLYAVTV